MAAIDFPNNPTDGQVFVSGNLSWTFKAGVGWTLNTGGGATDEVWIGPTEPTDPGLELWYDTDDTSSGAGTWNTAWGVIAVGPTAAARATAPNTNVRIGADLTFTTIAGRRYRLSRRVNSFIPSASNFGVALAFLKGTSVMGDGDQWMWSGGNYSGGILQTDFVGDGTTFTVYTAVLSVNAGAGTYVDVNCAQIFCEDIGPVTASPTDPPTPIMQWNAAWGVVGYGAAGSNQAIGASVWTDITGLATTFTPVAGRNYKVTAYLGAFGTANNSIIQGRIIGSGGQAFTEATLQLPIANWADQLRLQFVSSSFSGPTTLKVACQGTGGSGWSTHNVAGTNFIVVEDVGPTSGAIAIASPTPGWIPLTFLNGWQNYDVAGWGMAGLRKIGDIVYLRGLVSNANDTPNPITNVPAGYRPPFNHLFISNSAKGPIRMDVQSDGNVIVSPTESAGFKSYLELNQLFWSVTP